MKCGGRNKQVVVDTWLCHTDPPPGMEGLLVNSAVGSVTRR